MHSYSEQLSGLIEPTVTGLGYELVGVQYLPKREWSLVRVYIDHPDGIDLEDCEQVSHQISGVLDVADLIQERYSLEVSSPGLDRPLFKPSHFDDFAGSRVQIKLNASWEGRKNVTGRLLGFRANSVLLDEDGTECAVPFDMIGTARLVPKICQ